MEKCKTCEYEKICEMPDFVRNDLRLCKTYTPKIKKTNADRIRSMSDEELAEFLYGIDHFVDDGQCIVCFEEIRLNDDKVDILDWLQSEVKGSE